MTRNNYDQTFKETLVDLYQTGQSVLELSKEYGVNAGTIYKWIDLYGKDEPTDLSKAELKAMKSEIAKLKEQNEILKKAIDEYYRVLKPGGKLLTHDVAYLNPELTQIIDELRSTININVSPLSVTEWEGVFQQSNFSNVESTYGQMSLMSLKGMIRDEGFINTLNIIKNGHKKENREMFKNMHTFFTKTGKDLKYIAVCSQK